MNKTFKYGLIAVIVLGGVAYVTKETPQEKEARHLSRGNEYFTKGELQKARIEYKNAARIAPLDPEVSYRWGLVEEAEGNIRSAYANFIRAEQQDPAYAPAVLKVAHYNLVVEQYDEVRKRLDSVLKHNPDNAEAHALQAAMLLREKRWTETEKEARLALQLEPHNITAYSVLTGMAVAQGKQDEAESIVNEGIAKNPGDLSLLLLKVKIYENPLNLDKVNEAYQQIVKIRPNEPNLRVVLADIYTQANRLDDAENTLRTASTDIPADWGLKRRLIAFLDTYRSPAAAEKEMENLISANPDKSELQQMLAELYLKHNNVDKAVAVLEQSVARDDSDRQSLNARASLARISFRRGNRESAEKMVNAILEKSPHHSEALFIRANMLADSGSYQAAVTDLRQVIRDKPRFTEARQLLAEVLLLQGYPDLAIETLNQLVDIDPTNSAAKVRLAQMYGENKDPQRAITLLETVTRTDPGYPIGWENLARTAIAAGDNKRAYAAIETLRKNFKGQEQTADFLMGRLAQSSGEHGNARDVYTRIITTDPNSPLAEHALYQLVSQYNKPEELEETARFLSKLDTRSAYIHTILGECYQKLDKTDLAAAAFDKAISENPNTQEAYLYRARIALDGGNQDVALQVLERARKALPNDPRAGLLMAGAYSKHGEFDKAVILYDELLAQNAELEVAANNIAAVIADHFNTDPAQLERAEKLAERFAASKNTAYLDTLAWVYYRRGNTQQALSTIQRALSLNENPSPSFLYHVGAIQLAAGNKPKAKEALQKATQPGANYTGIEDAREKLKNL